MLHPGTGPIEKTELTLSFGISLIRCFAKPSRCFRGIAIHAQSQLKRVRDVELLLKMSGFCALEQIVGEWLVLSKAGNANEPQRYGDYSRACVTDDLKGGLPKKDKPRH
ncbi:MAG TPA: hypothetical protein VNB49_11290 [Candidatus Dormibacteraeota bacterium]|nr:hypothetical protein [Candidatus Dormibacteraeota bacterium]